MLTQNHFGTVDLRTAKPFIEKWHYSHVVPTGKNIFFGWWTNECLYAVADFGIGVNAFQASYLSKITGEPVTNSNLLELKRLCRIEPKDDHLPLTHFISLCHKDLKRMGYRYIVSFSDPAHNHSGGIYRASNYQSIGKTNPEVHTVDRNGVVRHRHYYYRYARQHNLTMEQARKELGLTPHKTVPKDRWFYKL